MNTTTRTTLELVLIGALASPFALQAAEKGTAERKSPMTQGDTTNAPAQIPVQMQARMQTMQGRMHTMQNTSDPKAMMPMMRAQMQDMQAMMKDFNTGCPMAGGQDGMMGGGSQGGMHGGPGMQGQMTPPSK